MEYTINLICNNCTKIDTYSFPVRKRFYGYTPCFYDQFGEVIADQTFSKIGPAMNEDAAQLIFCKNCRVPMLQGAPYHLQNPGNMQEIGVL